MPVSENMYYALESRVVKVEQNQAVKDEAMKAIVDRLTKIETILSRLTWLLVTGIGGAFIAFLLSGAVHVPVI